MSAKENIAAKEEDPAGAGTCNHFLNNSPENTKKALPLFVQVWKTETKWSSLQNLLSRYSYASIYFPASLQVVESPSIMQWAQSMTHIQAIMFLWDHLQLPETPAITLCHLIPMVENFPWLQPV
jgi:hypothetical protein